MYTGRMVAAMLARRRKPQPDKFISLEGRQPPHMSPRESASGMAVSSVSDTAETCAMCCATFEPDQSFQLSCGHAWHRQCLQRYVEIGIESASMSNLKCLSCGQNMACDDIKELVSCHGFTKYQRVLQNIEVDRNPDLRWCSTPGCETVLHREANRKGGGLAILRRVVVLVAAGVLAALLVRHMGLPWDVQGIAGILALALVLARTHASQKSSSCRRVDGLEVQCPTCKKTSCFDCGSAWHAGKSCKEAEEVGLVNWAAGRDVGRCPCCRRMIEKNAGCKHMTCSVCRYQFCWICTRKWSHNHLCLGIGTGTLSCEGMVAKLRSNIAGPSWVAGYLFFCVSLWLARLLGHGCTSNLDMGCILLTYDSAIEILGLIALLLAGCGLGTVAVMEKLEAWSLAHLGWRKHSGRACLFSAVCCAAMVVVHTVQSHFGPYGSEWIKLLWLANVLVVGHSLVWAQHPGSQHALSFLQKSRSGRLGLAASVLSPLLLMMLLQAATCIWSGQDAASSPKIHSYVSNTAPTTLLTQDSGKAWLTPLPSFDGHQEKNMTPTPSRTKSTHWNSVSKVSQALADARRACSECKENQALDAAFHAIDQAISAVASDMDNLESRMQRLESMMVAGGANQANTFGSWMQWLCSMFKVMLLMILVFALLAANAAFCFLVMLTTDDLENRHHAKHWQRALAASRSLLLCFLIMELSVNSEWPSVGFSIWWGARLFLPCFFAFLLWEVGDQLLKLLVLLGLLPALGMRALVMAGWPLDILPLAWGGAMSFALVADGADSELASLIRSIPFLQPRGVGLVSGVILWTLGQTCFMHGLVSVVLASSAPLAIETAWVSLAALS